MTHYSAHSGFPNEGPPPSANEIRRELLLSGLALTVRLKRGELGITMKELAERAGVSVRFLVQLEAGTGNISVARLADVAEALSTSAGDLLREADSYKAFEKKRVIALVGLRGAGKSTIGAGVAKKLRVPFAELDALVAREAGTSLATIFELHGESYYRNAEREALRKFLDTPDFAVLATGGSIVTAKEAYAMLRERAHVVWLHARAKDHWARVVAQGDGRPMAGRPHAMAELKSLLDARRELYGLAHERVDTSRATVAQSVARIVEIARPLMDPYVTSFSMKHAQKRR